MHVCHDSVLAGVDVPVIIKIYDHVWNNILPLTIGVAVLHWGIFTGRETMILSSITACEATAMTLFLYLANLLLLSVQPSEKK